MRKLIMKMSISIDGFVGSGNAESNWIFKSSDETSKAWILERLLEAGLIAMGRKTFEYISSYWPTATGPLAAPMNEIPKAVFTQNGFKSNILPDAELSPATASWAKARIFDGDLAAEIKKLKSEPGKPIYALGGAGFMRNLIATGLIDEYQLVTHPLVFGGGQAIFSGVAQSLDLKLADVKAFPGGIVTHIYHPAGGNSL